MSGSGEPEVVWGRIPAVALLAVGSERLILYLTSRRIVVAHDVKWGSGSMVAASVLGSFGGLVKGLRRGKGSQGKRRLEDIGVDEILRADKDNFSIEYGEVVNVVVSGSDGLTVISLLTNRDKLKFSAALSVDVVAELFGKGLGERVVVQKSWKAPRA